MINGLGMSLGRRPASKSKPACSDTLYFLSPTLSACIVRETERRREAGGAGRAASGVEDASPRKFVGKFVGITSDGAVALSQRPRRPQGQHVTEYAPMAFPARETALT